MKVVHHGGTEAQRKTKKKKAYFSLCLCASVVNVFALEAAC